MKITSSELDELIMLIHDQCGIVLDRSKAYLLEDRFLHFFSEQQFASYHDLIERSKRSPELTNRVVDTITTNETSFFRDKKPFDLLKDRILPDWLHHHANPQGQLAIWSAACSTGQEIYSIAITLKEFLGKKFSNYRIKLTGTDIANSVITKARAGRYSQMEVNRGISPEILQKYFVQDKTEWQICGELHGVVSFQKQNLLGHYEKLDKFDIVFCRNVAIYFSKENRINLFNKIADQLKEDGVLIIGSTESLFGICDRFMREEHNSIIYYRLKK